MMATRQAPGLNGDLNPSFPGPSLTLSNHCTTLVLLCYLAELGEVVLLAEGALPQARLVIPDGLVVALPLGPPVGYPRHVADDEFTWGWRLINCTNICIRLSLSKQFTVRIHKAM